MPIHRSKKISVLKKLAERATDDVPISQQVIFKLPTGVSWNSNQAKDIYISHINLHRTRRGEADISKEEVECLAKSGLPRRKRRGRRGNAFNQRTTLYKEAKSLGYNSGYRKSNVQQLKVYITRQNKHIGVRLSFSYVKSNEDTIYDIQQSNKRGKLVIPDDVVVRPKVLLFRATRASLKQDIQKFINRITQSLGGEHYVFIFNIRHEVTDKLPKHNILTVPLKDRNAPQLKLIFPKNLGKDCLLL